MYYVGLAQQASNDFIVITINDNNFMTFTTRDTVWLLTKVLCSILWDELHSISNSECRKSYYSYTRMHCACAHLMLSIPL